MYAANPRLHENSTRCLPQERVVHRHYPLPQNVRRALHLVGWNTLFLVLGLALIGVVGEMYLRLRAPFLEKDTPHAWSPSIGRIFAPNAEVRWTNRLDFWTESRTNSLGFLDREPIGLERAAASCHIAMIGDSYVEARQVPIADKFHVRLEELAAEELRDLDITTSAFGIRGTGQVNQLAYYDEFARALRPALLVLVFVDNDFTNNAPILDGLQQGRDPDRLTAVSATRGADGTITLRPPHPPSAESRLATMASISPPWHTRVTDRLSDMSPLARWLELKTKAWFPADTDPELIAWVALLSRRSPRYAALLDGWRPTTRGDIQEPFLYAHDLPPVYEDGLDFTGFALDQFRERADRDGAALVVLTSNYMGTRGDLGFDRLTALAEARGIPVIDYHDYVLRQGAEPRRDTRWEHDNHWNIAGHRWAAEALLEYLKENQEICTRRKRPATPPPLPSWLTDYESIASGEPMASSVFDVYAGENTVAYLKSPCSAADVQAQFFLHIVPEDVADLPPIASSMASTIWISTTGDSPLWPLAACALRSVRSPTIPSPASEPGSSQPTTAKSGWPSSPSARWKAHRRRTLLSHSSPQTRIEHGDQLRRRRSCAAQRATNADTPRSRFAVRFGASQRSLTR